MYCTDNETGSDKIQLTPKTALFLAALSVVAADGVIENAEIADLDKIVRGDKTNFALAHSTFKCNSYEECVDLVARSLDEKQKVALIAILLDLVMADGTLPDAEEKLISLYVSKFGIPVGVFKDVCHYIAMKNNLSLFDKKDSECVS
jgi:uncharacterized tellurite resistance protein B-like protein